MGQVFVSSCRELLRTKPSTLSTRRLALGMLLQISDRFDQAFGVNLFRLLDAFRLFRCIAQCELAQRPAWLPFRCPIYFRALPPQ
jgi:hypothetical protein